MFFKTVVTVRVEVLRPEIIVQEDVVVDLLETAEANEIRPAVSLEAEFPMAFVKNLGKNSFESRLRVGSDGSALDKVH